MPGSSNPITIHKNPTHPGPTAHKGNLHLIKKPLTPLFRCSPCLAAGLIAAASILIALSFTLDPQVRTALHHHQSRIEQKTGTPWRKTAEFQLWSTISRHGDWPQLMALGVGVFALAWWRRNPSWQRLALAAMLASTLAGITANALRLTTGRVRPRAEAKHGSGFLGPWHNGRITVGVPELNSFPSGHTATAFGFAAPVFLAKPLLGSPLLLGAAAIALSRMHLGAHHFSDIITAIIIALLIGWLVWRWLSALPRIPFLRSPTGLSPPHPQNGQNLHRPQNRPPL